MSTQDTTLPPLNYAPLHEFAEANRVDYNKLCAAVRAAIAAQAQQAPSDASAAFNDYRDSMRKLGEPSEFQFWCAGAKWGQAQQPDRVPLPQNADQAAAMAMLGEAWLREHAPERLTPYISVQEAWEAAGGNPGIKASKSELLEALRQLDAVCDQQAQQAQGVPAVTEQLIHHPYTPRKAEFEDFFLSMCERPLSIHEIARRCWKKAAAPQAEPCRRPISREQAIAIAREAAVAARDASGAPAHSYLPMDSGENWHPHEWVVEAIIAAPQAEPQSEYTSATPEEHAAIDSALDLVALPTIKVDRATYAALMESAKSTGKVIQAVVRDRLAPYAIPEPQPERESIPRVLFDGFAVLQALDPRAKARTSSENVSDVLDAVVKIMRAGIGTKGGE